MDKNRENLAYVKQVLNASNSPNNYPAIYYLWGVLVFVGFGIAEFKVAWTSSYWLIAAPIGMVISAWLGIKQDQQRGQQDRQSGGDYMTHFSALLAVIFLAIFTQQYQSILLLISLGYLLAGIHLDRLMLVVGVLAALIYLAIEAGLIHSNLVVGAVFAIGFFATGWGAAKLNAEQQHAV